jgi:hypothetical protein
MIIPTLIPMPTLSQHLLSDIPMPQWGKAPHLREEWLADRAQFKWELRKGGLSLDQLARGSMKEINHVD